MIPRSITLPGSGLIPPCCWLDAYRSEKQRHQYEGRVRRTRRKQDSFWTWRKEVGDAIMEFYSLPKYIFSVCRVFGWLSLPIAVEYPGTMEHSLLQPSVVNERMESTAFSLNSLSLYWTWWCRLLIALSQILSMINTCIDLEEKLMCVCDCSNRADKRKSVQLCSWLQEVNGLFRKWLISAMVGKPLCAALTNVFHFWLEFHILS